MKSDLRTTLFDQIEESMKSIESEVLKIKRDMARFKGMDQQIQDFFHLANSVQEDYRKIISPFEEEWKKMGSFIEAASAIPNTAASIKEYLDASGVYHHRPNATSAVDIDQVPILSDSISEVTEISSLPEDDPTTVERILSLLRAFPDGLKAADIRGEMRGVGVELSAQQLANAMYYLRKMKGKISRDSNGLYKLRK